MKKIVTIIVVLALATAAQAATVNGPATISYTMAPSGLAGHTIYYVSATSSTTPFEGFDIDVLDVDNELAHVFMGNTIYQDFNFAIPTQILEDTQVMQLSTAVMAVGARTAEDNTMLSATFAFNGGAADPQTGTHLDVVQVVLPDGSGVSYLGLNCLVAGQEYLVDFPEPASLVLLGLGGLALLRRRSA